MSSFVFEILSFQPHISNIIFFQRMIKQLFCSFLELILVQKTQHNEPAHQPGFGQVLLVPVISSFYIPSKKQINNETVQAEGFKFGQRVVLVIIPSRNIFLVFGWEIAMALLYVLVQPCCSQLGW